MKLDYLDSFFLNKPSAKDIINNDLIYFLEKQKKIGNIKNAGLIIGSNYNHKCFYHDIFKYYSVLYNLINTEDDKILKKLKKLKKKVLVRSPFNSGILTSKFILKGNFDKDDYRYKEIYGFDLKNKKVKLDRLFNKFNFNFGYVEQIALSFLIKNQNVDHIIFGPSKLKHIMDILYSRKKYKNYINSKLIERIIFFNKFLFKKYPTKSQFN